MSLEGVQFQAQNKKTANFKESVAAVATASIVPSASMFISLPAIN